MAALHAQRHDRPDESDLVRRAARGEEGAVRTIMQTHNRRLYRVARSIVCDGAEAEDVLQEAYLHAFQSLSRFRGEASLATWLTRIVLNESLQRVRRHTDLPVSRIELPEQSASHVIPFPISGTVADPERAMAQRQLCQLVERAIDELPQDFRTVLVARVVEGMSVNETAAAARHPPGDRQDAAASGEAPAQGYARRSHRSAVQRCVSLRGAALRADHRCRRQAAQPAYLIGGTSMGSREIRGIPMLNTVLSLEVQRCVFPEHSIWPPRSCWRP